MGSKIGSLQRIMNLRRIAIVGNGSLGLYTSIQVKLAFPQVEVHLYGEQTRKYAASTAAGAMANVYAEMENASGYLAKINERYLEMGKYSSHRWREFLNTTLGQNCITSDDTYVYLQKVASDFEKENYNSVIKYARLDQVLQELNQRDMKEIFPNTAQFSVSNAIKIKGEFSFSVKNLFNHLDSVASSLGVVTKDVMAEKIDLTKMTVTDATGTQTYDRLIVMAGINTEKILGDSNVIPFYQGVGVAMLINKIEDLEINKLRRGVFRSVNRGGAQCGIHFVPRENGKFYLGAGNYVSKLEEPVMRMDTIRYLLSTLEKDLIGRENSYQLTGDFVLGLRPRTQDGFPAIGALETNERVFVASGTNRAGLTWAPFIADETLKWLMDKSQSELINDWKPERSPIAFGSVESGVHYFTASRFSNAKEHGLISDDDAPELLEKKKAEFDRTARILVQQVSKKLNLPLDQTINPDNWAAILSS